MEIEEQVCVFKTILEGWQKEMTTIDQFFWFKRFETGNVKLCRLFVGL
jgi:hypothetical protein